MTANAWHAQRRDHAWRVQSPAPSATAFHRGLPGYAPTPLIELPALARELGVAHVLVKDESLRLGLPAFKALGASWAVHRALEASGADVVHTFVTATDGNHGRAVARFARVLGHRASIVIPRGVHPAAVEAIEAEGAHVTCVDGDYDQAVAKAAELAAGDPHALLLQDTAWPGYQEVPGWIVEGYTTLFVEIDEQLEQLGINRLDLIAVPVGVGSLLQAAVLHYRRGERGDRTAILSVESDAAACIVASLDAGQPVTVTTGHTSMAGLNCGTPSSLAWPLIAAGIDAAVAVSDAADLRAMRDLQVLGRPVGPCGAATLAGARCALLSEGADGRRAHLGIDSSSVIVLLATEGAEANPSLS